jgi:hypothetical protein
MKLDAQTKADQIAKAFTVIAGEKANAEIYQGIGYVRLTLRFVTIENMNLALRFHAAAGGTAPDRVRGLDVAWMFR